MSRRLLHEHDLPPAGAGLHRPRRGPDGHGLRRRSHLRWRPVRGRVPQPAEIQPARPAGHGQHGAQGRQREPVLLDVGEDGGVEWQEYVVWPRGGRDDL